MRIWVGVLAWLISAGVFAQVAGIHKDDIRYQQLANRLTPTFETVARGLTLGNNEFDQLVEIKRGKTTEQLCRQLFKDELSTTTNYCDSGQPGMTKTNDLEDASSCLNRLHDQANGVTVSPTNKNCYEELYKFIQVR